MISNEQIIELYKNGKSAYEILPLTKAPFFTHSSKISAKKIYDYLYNDSSIYLKRKKFIFDSVYANNEVTSI